MEHAGESTPKVAAKKEPIAVAGAWGEIPRTVDGRSPRRCTASGRCRARAGLVVAILLILVAREISGAAPVQAFTWPWDTSGPWPGSSRHPVTALDHPHLESRLAGLDPGPEAGFRFVAYGDQRALADGEWQDLVAAVGARAAVDDRLLFVIDTGDIVDDGKPTDQFVMLRDILAPIRGLPYLVAVGNHELHDNEFLAARANTAAFLSYLDPAFATERMYYRKDVGRMRFLFLDTSDFAYGEDGKGGACPPPPDGRAAAQLEWLSRELAVGRQEKEDGQIIVVVMHHPLLHSSKRHFGQARELWNCTVEGRQLVDLLADGGVDVVLTGHTHTYERFHLRREDGREIAVINVSGRPRTSFLWVGAGARRPRDIAGRENEWLAEEGFHGLESWEIRQVERMTEENEANQYAVFTVEPDGGLVLEMNYLAPGSSTERRASPVRLR